MYRRRQEKTRVGSAQRVVCAKTSSGQSANDHTAGASRAIKLEPDENDWDVEHLLSVVDLPWDRKQGDPTIGVSVPRTPLLAEVSLPTEPRTEREGKQRRVPGPRRVNIGKNVVIRKHGSTLRCQGYLAIATENRRSISRHNERKKRVENAIRDDAVGANPRDGQVQRRQSRTWAEQQQRSACGERRNVRISRNAKSGRRCSVAEFATPHREPTPPICTR